jgi:hypothetical protein
VNKLVLKYFCSDLHIVSNVELSTKLWQPPTLQKLHPWVVPEVPESYVGSCHNPTNSAEENNFLAKKRLEQCCLKGVRSPIICVVEFAIVDPQSKTTSWNTLLK